MTGDRLRVVDRRVELDAELEAKVLANILLLDKTGEPLLDEIEEAVPMLDF